MAKRENYVLYMHNFRGFDDTLIPLAQVNFMVGVNSDKYSQILGYVYSIFDENRSW